MYNARSRNYEDSWHLRFASWIVTDILQPQPGERILDLACGSGLVTFAAADTVGPKGGVVGVDISDGMLSVAKAKLEKAEVGNVKFIAHDIAGLESCKEMKGMEGSFDAITCVSAFVLLKEPVKALRGWRKFLKPSGRVVADVTHERNTIEGLCLEKTFLRMGLVPPYDRLWVTSEGSFRTVLGQAGFVVEDMVFKQQDDGNKVRRIEEADEAWEKMSEFEPAKPLKKDDQTKAQAKRIFVEEWKGYMDEKGECLQVDGVYVARARKPENTTALISGSCACGKLEWTSKALPTAICFCHCVWCRKASGGPFQAFLDFETDDVMIVASIGSKLSEVELSKNAKRGFCSNCGSSLTMQYNVEPQFIGMCEGSLDENSVVGGMKALDGINKKHIFVKDKVGWYDIPDDGVERQQHMESASRLLVYDD